MSISLWKKCLKSRIMFFAGLALTVFMFTGFNASTVQAGILAPPIPPGAVDFGFLEGTITDITVYPAPVPNPHAPDPIIGTVTVNGVVASVTTATTFRSFTNLNLTFDQIKNGPLPDRFDTAGNPIPGFLGAICLCDTIMYPDGTMTVDSLWADPAEDVIGGLVTEHNCLTDDCSGPNDVLKIAGVKVVHMPASDTRIPSPWPVSATKPPYGININGQILDPANNPLLPVIATVQGYFFQDAAGVPSIYYSFLEIDGGIPLSPLAEISVSKTQCKDKNNSIEYRIDGAVINPSGSVLNLDGTVTNTDGSVLDPTVSLTDAVSGASIGTTSATFKADPSNGAWSYNFKGAGSCATSVTASFLNASITFAP